MHIKKIILKILYIIENKNNNLILEDKVMITAYNRITRKYESVDSTDVRKSYNKYAITFDRYGRPIYNGDRVERWCWNIKDGGWVERGHQNIYFNDYWWLSGPNVMWVLIGRKH